MTTFDIITCFCIVFILGYCVYVLYHAFKD